MRNTSRLFDVAITGPKSLSWQVWILATAVPSLFQVLLGSYGEVLTGLFAVVSAVAIAGILILPLGKFVLPHVVHLPARRLLILGTYIATSAILALAVTLILAPRQFADPFPVDQLVAGAVFYTWFFILASLVTNDTSEFRAKLKTLSSIRAQLQNVAEWREVTLENDLEREVAKVRQQLTTAQAKIKLAVATNESTPGLSDSIVQPLLRELDNWVLNLPDAVDVQPEKLAGRRSLSQVFRQAMLPQPAILAPSSLFIASTWVVTGITMHSFIVTLLAPILAGSVLFASLWIYLTCTQQWPSRAAIATRSLLSLLSWFVAGVLAGILPLLIADIPLPALISMGIQTSLVIAVFSFALAYREVGMSVRENIVAQNTALEKELAISGSIVRTFRERAGHYIHGEIQSVLVSAERKLSTHSNESIHNLEVIMAKIGEALDALEQNLLFKKSQSDPMQIIQDLKAMWRGSLEIHESWSARARERVMSNEISQSVLSELLIEIITNASKHEMASQITIDFDIDQDDCLQITATSRGANTENLRLSKEVSRRPSSQLTIGRGMELMNEVCLDWSIVRSNRETVFKAALPIVRQVVSGGLQR